MLAKHCEAKLVIHQPFPDAYTFVMSQDSSDAFLTVDVRGWGVEIWGTLQSGFDMRAEAVRLYTKRENASIDEVFENVKDWVTTHWWSGRRKRRVKISLDFEVTFTEPEGSSPDLEEPQQTLPAAVGNVISRLVQNPSAYTTRRDLAVLAVLHELQSLRPEELSARFIREHEVEAIIAPIVTSLSPGDQEWLDAQRYPHGEWYDEVESHIKDHTEVKLLGIRS